jgi:hypothetical protein
MENLHILLRTNQPKYGYNYFFNNQPISITFVYIMPTLKNIFVVSLSTCLLLFAGKSYASIVVTGTIESKKLSEKYTLKNLSAFTHRTTTFATLKANLDFKGFANTNSIYNTNNAAYLKYNKGNVSYVIPYNHKVLLSKFKIPTPNN